MTDTESIDQEPSEAESSSPAVSVKTRQPFAKLRRELSEEELSSPAVQRLLLDDVERLERQVSELKTYRDRFHSMDKRAAILEQKVRKSLASEIFFSVCLSIGAAALGYAPAVWNNQPLGYLLLIFGFAIILGGIASRLVQR